MNTPVNFELAKLLKEKGFDEPCNHVHYENKTYAYTKSGGVRNSHKKEQQWVCTAPTIAEVVMWLYEKHGLWVVVNFANKNQWYFDCKKVGFTSTKEYLFKSNYDFNSPTEAYEAGIEYTLNNLI